MCKAMPCKTPCHLQGIEKPAVHATSVANSRNARECAGWLCEQVIAKDECPSSRADVLIFSDRLHRRHGSATQQSRASAWSMRGSPCRLEEPGEIHLGIASRIPQRLF